MMLVPLDLPTYELDGWGGNCVDDCLVEWIVTDEEGWSSPPPVRTTVEDLHGRDGAWDGPGYDGARVITLTGVAICPNRLTQNRAKDRLNAAASTRRSLYPLVVHEEHEIRMVLVRRTGEAKIADKGAYAFDWSITLVAPDPRKYDHRETTVSVGAGEITTSVGADGGISVSTAAHGGRRYPRRYPASYTSMPAAAAPRALMVENRGTRDTGGVIEIRGALTNPTIVNMRSGQVLGFDLTLSLDDVLTIDLLDRTVVLGGLLSRRSAITSGSEWWLHQPGQTWLRVGGELPGAGDPRMTVRYRSAWK